MKDSCRKKQNCGDQECDNKNSPTEIILDQILNNLECIQQEAKKIVHSEIKHKIYSAIFKVQQNVTTLAFRVGNTGKENMELAHKLKNLTDKNKHANIPNRHPIPEASTIAPANTQPSFSEILKSSAAAYWKTPPQRSKKIETIIKIKDQKNPREVINEIKKTIKESTTDGKFKNVKQLPSGSVIIECENETQQVMLKNILGNKNMEVRNIANTDPMIMITGILKGIPVEHFITEFVEENYQLKEAFGSDIVKHFKYITKKECRNNSKENWIYQTTPEIQGLYKRTPGF